MNIDAQTKTGVLRLSVCDGTKDKQLKTAATLIRGLPGVLRVAVNQAAAGQLDILFVDPAVGLLREIHTRLRQTHTDMVAAKVF